MGLPKTFQDLLPQWWGRRETPAVQGEPEDPFQALQRELNRAFASFWRAAEAGPLAGAFPTPDPRTDVVESDTAVEVSLELPGLEEKDLEVSVTGTLLTVKAEKKHESERHNAGWHVAERRYGLIQRSLTLPAGIDPDRAEARFRNGVLTITVPKTVPTAPAVKKIEVQHL